MSSLEIYLQAKGNSNQNKITNMKPIIILLIPVFFIMQKTHAQDSPKQFAPDPIYKSDKNQRPEKYSLEYYTVKARKHNTAGWILFGLGTAMGVGGYISYEHSLHQEYNWDQMGDAIVNSYGSAFLMVAGSTMVLISIPVLISSWHYKKMALRMSASLKMETGHELNQSGMISNHYPAIGVTIRL